MTRREDEWVLKYDIQFTVPKGARAPAAVRAAMQTAAEKLVAQLPKDTKPGEKYVYREACHYELPRPAPKPAEPELDAKEAAEAAVGAMQHGPGELVLLSMRQDEGLLLLSTAQAAVRCHSGDVGAVGACELRDTIAVLRVFEASLQLPPPLQRLADLGWNGIPIPNEETSR